MEVISNHVGASDESSCSDSPGPTTPVCSPLVHPIVVKHGTGSPYQHFLDFTKQPIFPALSISSESCASYDESPRPSIENICFIGAGYVGGPTAAIIALHNPNIRVEVVDKDVKRIKRWNSGHLPIHEPKLNEVVQISRDGARARTKRSSSSLTDENLAPTWERQQNLFFSTDVSGSISRADIIFLAVNTSTKTFGIGAGRATDMSACDAAVREIAAHARPNAIIVEKSTVPCGTARRIKSMLHSLRPNIPFEILSNPEFLAEGTAIEDLMTPDRVIIGCSNTSSGHEAAEALAGVYGAWVPHSRILTSNVWSSELSKLVANAMLAQRISSVNSISAICEETGANVDEIAKAVGLDSRIGSKFLKAGLGFGGSCFRKDISSLTYLAESLGLDDVAEYWDQVNKMNASQRQRFARRVIKKLDGNLVGKKIAILGFAFKPNTGDPRESVAIEVVKDLLVEQPAQIAIFDAYCKRADITREIQNKCCDFAVSTVQIFDDVYDACKEADAIILATECDEFRNASGIKAHFPVPDRSYEKLTTMNTDGEVEIDNFESKTWYSPPPQPLCRVGKDDCPDCHSEATISDQQPRHAGPVDWKKIISDMRVPRWIFDGRNVLDVDAIKSHGISVNVESIGRRC